VRLALDEQLSARRIAKPLRTRGHDVLATAEEPDLAGLPDEELLERMSDARRILVTCDRHDYPILARAWAEDERLHAGIVIVWSHRNDEYRAIVYGVQALLEARPTHGEWRGLVLGL